MRLLTALSERRSHLRANALRTAVEELPIPTKRAMLAAIEEDQELIVGAYTDRRGRVCPMLAAHRRGARAGVGSFPGAWDAFGRACRPRLATDRELEILKALLEESVSGSPSEHRPGGPNGRGGRPRAAAPSAS
jgi:hypothetical protein